MKLYVIATLSIAMLLFGLPAMAKDHRDHNNDRGAKSHQYQQGKQHNRWPGNKTRKDDRHHNKHGGKYYGNKHSAHSRHHNARYNSHFRMYDRKHDRHSYRHHQNDRHHYSHQKHRRHDNRGAYLAGGLITGVLLNEYYNRH